MDAHKKSLSKIPPSLFALTLSGTLLLLPGPAAQSQEVTSESSQTSLREEARLFAIEQQKSAETALAKKKEAEPELGTFLGGWFTSTYRYYKDIDNNTGKVDFLRWSWKQDLYLWAYLGYKRTYTAYVRLLDSYVDRGVGPTYTGIGADNEGPSFDQAYVRLDLLTEYDIPAKITAGRHYLFIGRGVVYSDTNDGFTIETSGHPVYHKFFIAATEPREDNIDYSVPGFEEEGDRVFLGGEVAYTLGPNLSLYVFGLRQNDNSEQNPENPRQNYHYNSRYLGGGGSLKTPGEGLNLWSEWITERGRGFTDALVVPLEETRVKAQAFLGGARFQTPFYWSPILEAEFAYGSGDEDRARVTNTEGGDLDGTDKNFLYFGHYLAGYAFQPQLSNLYIYTAGGSVKPFDGHPLLGKSIMGTKLYWYRKDRPPGGTSDIESTRNEKDVGQEIDLYIHWKVNEHITTSVRYGIFFPGESFKPTERSETVYFSTSLKASF